MSQFLRDFTTYRTADNVRLILYEGQRVEPQFFTTALERATRKYGEPVRRLLVSGSGLEEFENKWILGTEDLPTAVDFLVSLKPFPEHWLGGPMVLGMEAKFCLRDPDTTEPFPFQGSDVYGEQRAGFRLPLGLSQIYLRLANPSTCFLFLSLPFNEGAPELRAYVHKLQASLPFKLSSKHWSRWQLNAQGTKYYRRKTSMRGDDLKSSQST
jgi:hypothetical protein